MTTIRSAGMYDLPGIYRVCRITGEPEGLGPDAPRNPDLLGHIYAGPYVIGEGELAGVLSDDRGVAGYVLGCRDTRAFEAWTEAHWWPPLRAQYPSTGGAPEDAELIRTIHAPGRSPEFLLDDFPAHLHIDLLPRAQGQGHGRRLIDWLVERMVARGVRGVHLGVGNTNSRAIAFYEHLGFDSRHDDGDTLWMAKPLEPSPSGTSWPK